MLTSGRDKLSKSEKNCRALVRVGQSINMAVERFASVGETMGDDNPEIKMDMYDACKDARTAGCILEQLCDLTADSGTYNVRSYSDRSGLVRGARALLSSVTRVLLIADTVVVKQLLTSKDKVSISLNRLENVANFTEFVKAYSQFGSEMVELAHLASDRQSGARGERHRAEMSAARKFLERSTMMLLTSSKACLRHPDSDSAKENRDTIFLEMRRAMDSIHIVIKDGVLPTLAAAACSFDTGHSRRSHRHGHTSRYASSSNRSSSDWPGCDVSEPLPTAFNAIKRFEELVEMSRVTLCKGVFRERLLSAFDAFVELTQDFTDSAYTRHENREKILLLCDRTKLELNQLLRLGICLDEAGSSNPTEDFEETILQTFRAVNDVKHQLRNTALDQAEELFKITDEFDVINQLRSQSLAGDSERLNDYVKIFSEHSDHLAEVCRLLHNVATSENIQIHSNSTESQISIFSPQILNACLTLCGHPSSRIAKDNLEVFLDFWIALYSDVHQYSKDIRDLLNGLDTSYSYTNQTVHGMGQQSNSVRWQGNISNSPKAPAQQAILQQQQTGSGSAMSSAPGTTSIIPSGQSGAGATSSSGTTASASGNVPVIMTPTGPKPAKPLDNEERARIAKAGLEMKMASSELDAEAEKWPNSEDNDIVRRAKNMSGMAFSMYQFTRGEGELKTTQDLFTQAEFFAEEANKFYKLVRHFSYQVPTGPAKKELLDHLDKVPTFVQQLQFTVKNPTVGKAATFTKVDNVIKETKNLMMYVSKTVNSCLTCSSKYNLDMGAARARSRTLSPSGRYGEDDSGYEGMSSGMGSKGGTASSDPNI